MIIYYTILLMNNSDIVRIDFIGNYLVRNDNKY